MHFPLSRIVYSALTAQIRQNYYNTLVEVQLNQLHKPVLLNEVIDSFSIFENHSKRTSDLTSNLIYFDGTYGRGGHFRAIQKKFSPAISYLTDQDSEAIKQALHEWEDLVKVGKVRVFH